MPEYLPAALISIWLTVPKRTIQRWAKEDQWSTRGHGNHITYSTDDAARTYELRRLSTDTSNRCTH